MMLTLSSKERLLRRQEWRLVQQGAGGLSLRFTEPDFINSKVGVLASGLKVNNNVYQFLQLLDHIFILDCCPCRGFLDDELKSLECCLAAISMDGSRPRMTGHKPIYKSKRGITVSHFLDD